MQVPIAETLLAALAARRPREAEHCRRVSIYALRLASQYGLPADMLEAIAGGALLHDIGKMYVPERILDKPDRLSAREWTKLRRHPEMGVELVERWNLDPAVAEIVLHHHERHDGTGYPDRLAGQEIRWMVRIVSVADSFDALTSPRGYRKALSPGAARSLIAREAGSRFCPWVVAGLLSLPERLLVPPPSLAPRRFMLDAPAMVASAGVFERWPSRQNEPAAPLP